MINKQRLYWTLQILGWSMYVLLQVTFSAIASAQGVSVKRILFFVLEAVICLGTTHLFRYTMNQWGWLKFSLPKLIPKVIAVLLLMSLLVYFLRIPASILSGRVFDPATVFNVASILYGWSFYIILFSPWFIFYFTYHYIESYNTSLKYQASRVETELKNLKAQLNPHFIFNALNSIRALVDENPEKSKQAINHLANILRNSLATDKNRLTTFDEELAIVKDYLSLESIRFEKRLVVLFNIDPQSRKFLVPPLMIQTHVENGIKHGISKLTEGGTLSITTVADRDALKIYIRNSGQYRPHFTEQTEGLGLKNTTQRLSLLYGERAFFKIVNEDSEFVLTEIVIPNTN